MDDITQIIYEHSNQVKRKQKTKRIQAAITVLGLVLLLIPTICCILLFGRMNRMQSQLDLLLKLHGEEAAEEQVEAHENGMPFAQAAEVIKGPQNEKEESGNLEEASKEAAAGAKADDMEKADREAKAGEDDGEEAPESDGAAVYADDLIEGRKVYLTFDDGPSKFTDEILNTLAEYDVKATFFVIGREDEKSKELYQRIVEEGHTLAMHSYSHKYDSIYKSIKAFQDDFEKISSLLYEVTGERPVFYRFPGGSSNTVSKVDMKKLISYFNDSGIVYFDWNVVNGDATGEKLTSKELIQNVMDGVKGRSSSVVLMHDTDAKASTVESLPKLLKRLQKEDAVILPITVNTRPVQHVKADSVES